MNVNRNIMRINRGYILREIMITGIIFLLATAGLFSQELTGQEIIQKVNELFNPETSYGKMKMTIVTSSGQKRAFISESWSKNKGEKNLVRYQEPRRVKGQAV